jgi:hypothetical protein
MLTPSTDVPMTDRGTHSPCASIRMNQPIQGRPLLEAPAPRRPGEPSLRRRVSQRARVSAEGRGQLVLRRAG